MDIEERTCSLRHFIHRILSLHRAVHQQRFINKCKGSRSGWQAYLHLVDHLPAVLNASDLNVAGGCRQQRLVQDLQTAVHLAPLYRLQRHRERSVTGGQFVAPVLIEWTNLNWGGFRPRPKREGTESAAPRVDVQRTGAIWRPRCFRSRARAAGSV